MAGEMIVADADREIEMGEAVKAAGRDDLVNAQLVEAGPVRNRDVRVN